MTDPGLVVLATTVAVALAAGPDLRTGLRWAGAALLFCVLLPYAALGLLMRRGRVSDRQIVRAEERVLPGLAALSALVAGLVVLHMLGAPRAVVTLMLAYVAGLLALLAAGIVAKASLHTAVIAGAVAVVVVTFGWALLPAGLLVPLVGWARVRGGRHTVGQVVAGGLLGAASVGLVYGLLRGPAEPAAVAFARVPAPLAGAVTAAGSSGERLLVATDLGAGHRPRASLSAVARDGAARGIALRASTPYGQEGTIRRLAAEQDTLLAVAGAVGGAHGNVRWSVWRGRLDGVAEEKQEFWVFGGHEMGGLTGAGHVGGAPVLAGAWQSQDSGLDVATWHAQGTTWARDAVAKDVLASTATRLASAVNAADTGEGMVLVGSATLLGSGPPRQVPAAWFGRAGAGSGGVDWRRADLPIPAGVSGLGNAEQAACTEAGCVIAGRVGTALVVWQLAPDPGGELGEGRGAELLPLPVGESDTIVGIAVHANRACVGVAHPEGEGTVLCRVLGEAMHAVGGAGQRGAPWHDADGLEGDLVALASTSAGIWALTQSATGPVLWLAQPAA